MSCSCFNASHVDWLLDGPLILWDSKKVCVPSEGCCCCVSFNWPCCDGSISTNWTTVERAGKRHFILPMKEPFPLFICALPVFWIHVCLLICTDKAIGMVITHDLDQQTLTAEVREKTAFAAVVESRRTKLTKAYIEDKSGSLFKQRQARVIIQSDDGQAPLTSPFITIADDFKFQSLKSLVDQINKTIEQTTPPPAAMMMYNSIGMMPQGVVVAEPVNVPMSNVQVIGPNNGGYPGGGGQPVLYGYAGAGGQVYMQQQASHNPMYVQHPPPGVYGAPPGQQQPYPMQQPPMQMQMQMQYVQQQPQPGQPVHMVMSNTGVPTYVYAAPGAPMPMYAGAPPSQPPPVPMMSPSAPPSAADAAAAYAANSNIDKNEAQAHQPPVYGDTNSQSPGAMQMASAPPLSKDA